MTGPCRIAKKTLRDRTGGFKERVFDAQLRLKAQFLRDPRAVDPIVAQIRVIVGDDDLDLRKVPPRHFDQCAFLIVFTDHVEHPPRRRIG